LGRVIQEQQKRERLLLCWRVITLLYKT
jgi:hypothetical protein